MPHFVYNEFDMTSWDTHIFPTNKYILTKQLLLKAGIKPTEFSESESATLDEIKLVHTQTYLSRIEDYVFRNPFEAVKEFEALCDDEVFYAFKVMCGGSILACRFALENKNFGFHIGGGFHHSFDDHGEGFCILNDVAVAIRVMKNEGSIKKVAIIDVDVHQGNGTAWIFRNDPDVFTFSIHNEYLYPLFKPESNLDIGLTTSVGDDEYNAYLRKHIPEILDTHKPELVIYLAGADPYKEDKLGGMNLTIEGCNMRDEIVIGETAKRNIPAMICLAGGYANKTEDIAKIHFNTAKTCIEKYNLPLFTKI